MKRILAFSAAVCLAVSAAVCFLVGCSEADKNSGNEIDSPAENSVTASPDIDSEENDDLYKLEFFSFSVSDELTEPEGIVGFEGDIISYLFSVENSSVNFHVADSQCSHTPELCMEHEIDILSEKSDSISRTDTEINGFQCTELKYDLDFGYTLKCLDIYLHCEENHIKISTTYKEDDEQQALKFAREIADSVVYHGDYHITDEDKHFVSDSYEAQCSPKWRLFVSDRECEPDLDFVYALAEDDVEELLSNIKITGGKK